jgi:hypothetical protein
MIVSGNDLDKKNSLASVVNLTKKTNNAKSKFNRGVKKVNVTVRELTSEDKIAWLKKVYEVKNFRKINDQGVLKNCDFDDKEELILKFVHPDLYNSLTKYIFNDDDEIKVVKNEVGKHLVTKNTAEVCERERV